MKPEVPAIRMRGLGCYFGSPLEMDGVNHPREAWRTLLRFAGVNLRQLTDQNTHRTSVVGGYAVRDVSLDISRGSVVCLAGPSGAGKSVLLQMLAGATAPTSGRAEIFGTVSSLLAGGGDLNERLSAEDNIRQSAEFDASPPAERDRFVAEVVEFAELQGFEHVPLRTFSTGMRLRLNVALVLCSRADILLLDAVMAVGDIAFQQKCVERVRDLADQERTIVAVFEDDQIVQQIATRVLSLADGRIVGDTASATHAHVTSGTAADVSWDVISDLPEDDAVALRGLELDARREGDASFVDLTMSFEVKLPDVRCRPSVVLNRGEFTLFRTLAPQAVTFARGRPAAWVVRIPIHTLPDGSYTLMVNMQSEHRGAVYAMKAHEAVTLHVRRGTGGVADEHDRDTPLFAVRFPWESEPVESEGAV